MVVDPLRQALGEHRLARVRAQVLHELVRIDRARPGGQWMARLNDFDFELDVCDVAEAAARVTGITATPGDQGAGLDVLTALGVELRPVAEQPPECVRSTVR